MYVIAGRQEWFRGPPLARGPHFENQCSITFSRLIGGNEPPHLKSEIILHGTPMV